MQELTFDDLNIGEFTDELKSKFEDVKGLLVVRMNGCGITTLKNFPNFENVVRLELMENSFAGSDLAHLNHLAVGFRNEFGPREKSTGQTAGSDRLGAVEY